MSCQDCDKMAAALGRSAETIDNLKDQCAAVSRAAVGETEGRRANARTIMVMDQNLRDLQARVDELQATMTSEVLRRRELESAACDLLWDTPETSGERLRRLVAGNAEDCAR